MARGARRGDRPLPRRGGRASRDGRRRSSASSRRPAPSCRGVLELPQETEEAAANMRRVVADQIKALNELSALVSRSSRAVDAAPPASSRGASSEPRQPASRRSCARRRRRCRWRRPRRTAAAGAGTAPRSSRRARRRRPAAAPAARAAEPAPEPRAESEQGGWLSNLLTRASQDDEAAGCGGAGRNARARTRRRAELARRDLGRHRAHDRPRGGRRALGPLQPRRAQRLHPAASTRCRASRPSTRSAANTAASGRSSRPSTAMSTSSSA